MAAYDWSPPTIVARACYPTDDGWRTLQTLIRPQPAGMASKHYWEAEMARLRAHHEELRDVGAFVVKDG